MHLWNKLYELFLGDCFKDEPFVEFEIRLTLKQQLLKNVRWAYLCVALDRLFQGASQFCC